MAFHTKKQFADLCDVATNYLSVAIGRGKVILTGELIDDTNEKNAAFLQKRAKNVLKTPAVSKNTPSVSPVEEEKESKTTSQNVNTVGNSEKNRSRLSYQELEKEKKLADLIKTEADTQHRQLQIQKLIGASIPTELVKEVVSTLSKQLISSFKDGADNFIIEISKRKNLSGVEVAELKGQLILIINNSSTKAISESKKRIKNIVNEYSEKREVGEHD